MTQLKPDLGQTDTPCIYQNLEFRWNDVVTWQHLSIQFEKFNFEPVLHFDWYDLNI